MGSALVGTLLLVRCQVLAFVSKAKSAAPWHGKSGSKLRYMKVPSSRIMSAGGLRFQAFQQQRLAAFTDIQAQRQAARGEGGKKGMQKSPGKTLAHNNRVQGAKLLSLQEPSIHRR